VLVIHEKHGADDWVRGVADQLAEAGYIAVAPDLLSGYAERRENPAISRSAPTRPPRSGKLPPDGVPLT